MINVFFAYDDNDSDLGDYFEESFNTISSQLSTNEKVKSSSIRGLDCTEANLNSAISSFDFEHFVFIGICHGTEDQLLTESEAFISGANSHFFAKSLFYTSACSCLAVLGNQLVQDGCLSFVGYNGPVEVWEGYYDVFIDCENFGIVEFLNTNKTIGETVAEMITRYNDTIDELSLGNVEDIIVASLLVSNRDKLDILGDKNLTSQDLFGL
jgi:hypothetical protein